MCTQAITNQQSCLCLLKKRCPQVSLYLHQKTTNILSSNFLAEFPLSLFSLSDMNLWTFRGPLLSSFFRINALPLSCLLTSSGFACQRKEAKSDCKPSFSNPFLVEETSLCPLRSSLFYRRAEFLFLIFRVC